MSERRFFEPERAQSTSMKTDSDYCLKKCLRQWLHEILLGSQDDRVTEAWTHLKQVKDDIRLTNPIYFVIPLQEFLEVPNIDLHQVPLLFEWYARALEHIVHESLNFTFDAGNIILPYLRDTKFKDITELMEILNVLQKHPMYLFNGEFNFNGVDKYSFLKELCAVLVKSLTNFLFGCDPEQNKRNKECLPRLVSFFDFILKSVPENGNQRIQLICVCLKTLYSIISDPKHNQPGMALVVLQLDDPNIRYKVPFVPQEMHLARALKVLCSNLPTWPMDKLSVWVMDLMEGLESGKNFTVLNEVTNEMLPQLFQYMRVPVCRKNCFEVAFYMLKKQSTPMLFVKLQNDIIRTYEDLSKAENEKECLQNLVDIVNALVLRFSDIECNKQLTNYPVLPNKSAVSEILNGSVWADEPAEDVDYQIYSNNGKVGLTNLGNTCYMNSVLQALVMTRQFCHEVLNYKPCGVGENSILKKLQNLFALLMYSERNSWAPTEILQVCRPSYFIAGQQQDSSEFLCHLLDILHEQEKSLNTQYASCDPMTGQEPKSEEKDCKILPNACDSLSECEPMESLSSMKRWTTEENLSEGAVLQRKTQSLADFTNGEDLSQTQNLSDSHSDSTDSGIQSVGGEDNSQTSLVHRVFGGQTNVTYQCAQCRTSSHNTDKFRDLQLCFPEEISENDEVSVQDLLNYYLNPETLTGDNKYRCDKCTKLCDAQRLIKIREAPSHLILTLKHFRYDSESRLRTKLRHKVTYNETIHLEVCTPSGVVDEVYHLYAAVVHSGYSMDYGHYFTYSKDAKNNWYKFNDSYVSQTTFNDFKRLEPPNTPYILFYGKASMDGAYEEDKPDLLTLSKSIRDLVENDVASYEEKNKQQLEKKRRRMKYNVSVLKFRDSNNPDDDNPPPSSCRDVMEVPSRNFLF